MSYQELITAYEHVVTSVATELKQHGFTRRGSVMRLFKNDNCAIIAFQKSRYSGGDMLEFTVNLGIVCGKLLDMGRPLNIKSALIWDAHLADRLNTFLPEPQDDWWRITTVTKTDRLMKEITDLLEEKALPYLGRYLQTENIIALWESGQSPGLTSFECNRFLARLKEVG